MKDLINNYLALVRQETDDILDVNLKQLEQVSKLVIEATEKGGSIHFTGIGKPSYVAKYMASLYSSTGTSSYFLDGTEAVHGSLGQLKKEDIVIAISNSGETKELLATVLAIKKLGNKIIGVSRNLDSTLAKLCEGNLLVIVENEGDDLNKPPRISIIKEMLVLQILSLILQEHRQLTKQEYVKYHPGGSIGESIKIG